MSRRGPSATTSRRACCPVPTGLGPTAHYDQDHLARLRLIKRLQAQDVPLAKIRARLDELADEEIASLAEEAEPAAPPSEQPGADALAYIRGVLGPPRPVPPPSASRPVPAAPMFRSIASLQEQRPSSVIGRSIDDQPAFSRIGKPERKPKPPGSERSSWDRMNLAPDIELHVRRPLDRRTNKLLERLLSVAREEFTED